MNSEMNLQRTINKIFFPRIEERVSGYKKKLVHYTSASSAVNILRSKQFWMRSVSCMNDYQEVLYGVNLLDELLNGEEGISIENSLKWRSHIWGEAKEWFERNKLERIYAHSFITCFSEQDMEEEKRGRLSMWRGYSRNGGVAIVLKSDIFRSEFDGINVVTSPVEYLDRKQLKCHLLRIANNIENNIQILESLNDEEIRLSLYNMLVFGVLSLKHPGFKEEQEWRLISIDGGRINLDARDLVSEIETVNGIPQYIKKIPLTYEKKSSENGFSINEILDHIIIGPTQYGLVLFETFYELLSDIGIESPESKIVLSDIPYRA